MQTFFSMSVSGKCFIRRVFKMADEDRDTERRRTNFALNCLPLEREGEG